MLKNYFKIAWRNLVRQKVFSSINVTGLALGLTCSLLIMLWVNDERSIDRFHVNAASLYQVYERSFYEGKVEAGYSTQGLLAGELKRVVPEIQYASGFEYVAAPGTKSTFSAGDKVNKMTGFYAGEDYFTMFSYPLLEGTAAGALRLPGTIAVSREMAEYFFGDSRTALGKTLLFDDQEELKISGVFENVPGRSSQQFDFLRPWKDFEKTNPWIHNWGNTSPATYIQLQKDADATAVEVKIRDFIYRYKKEDPAFRVELALQRYTERYLHSNLSKGYADGGRIEYVHLFTVVAIFILVIACINFMSLSTAQSEKRAREVGLRKVVGAARFSLVLQFIGEALLLTFLAGMTALAAVALLLPAFNTVTGKQLEVPFDSAYFWMGMATLLLSTGILAGSYPALFLSSLKPVRVLKGAQKFNWKSSFFRQGLVVFQFVLATVLIIGTIVTYRQMEYIQGKNIGYERDNLLYIPLEGELKTQYGLFKQRALAIPGVADISKMRNSPTVIEHHTNSISWPGKPDNVNVSFADGVVGYDFVRTMKLELKEGRDFSQAFGIDSAAYILNETAVEKMGLTEPLGKTVSWGGRNGTVIGILKDFHFNSMHHAIEPLILRLDENWSWGTVMVRLQGGDLGNTISSLQNLYRDINPGFPFSYQFSDAEFDKLYRSEQVVSRLSRYFSFLAIFISCLGLYGLAAFVAAKRTKEIGVRKVLGASVPGIVTLLSGSFLKLVGIALLVAFPFGGLILQRWLNQFAYKTDIEWWVFGVAGLFAIMIAVITISFQSIKAAMANPVKSLRTE